MFPDLFGSWWGFVVAAVGGVIAIIFARSAAKSEGKKEGVQQERAKQVETARKETAVAIDTKNRVEAQPESEVRSKFSRYVKKGPTK